MTGSCFCVRIQKLNAQLIRRGFGLFTQIHRHTEKTMTSRISSPVSNTSNHKWDIIITPKGRWFDLQLREIWEARELIWLFVWRDLVSVYTQTVIGPFWYFLQPTLQTLLYFILFGLFVRFPTDGIPPFLFYLSGLILWGFFSATFNRISQTFIGNTGLYGKVYFPRLVIPISLVISNFISFLFQSLLLIIAILIYTVTGTTIQPNVWLLLLPGLFFMLACFGFSLGIIVSAFTVRYRDLQHFIGFGVQFLLYATPIVYPLSAVPVQFRRILLLNPLVPIFEAFRYAVLGQGNIDLLQLGYSCIVMVILFSVSLVVFHRAEGTFMDFV